MKILDRYIGKQVLLGSVIGVFVLSFLIVFVNIFKKLLPRLVDNEVPATFLLEFMGLVLPFSLIFTIPWGFLTAILLVYGRLSADNELVSIRMAGMSFPRVCAAVFAIAVGFSGISLFMNVSLAPRCQLAMRKILYDIVSEDPLALFQPGEVTNQLGDMRIYIKDRKEDTLYGFQMFQLAGGRPVTAIRAEEVDVRLSPDKKEFVMEMRGAKFETIGTPGEPATLSTGIESGESIQKLSLEDFQAGARKKRLSAMVNSELRGHLASGLDPNTQLPMDAATESSIKTELSKRFSFSMACITFAFLGVPLGVTAQRRETSVGFAIGLVVAMIYFFLIIFADMLREDPASYPHLLMWVPNVIFLSLGLWLFWRQAKK